MESGREEEKQAGDEEGKKGCSAAFTSGSMPGHITHNQGASTVPDEYNSFFMYVKEDEYIRKLAKCLKIE